MPNQYSGMRETRICKFKACGNTFEVKPSRKTVYCCRKCGSNDKKKDKKPPNPIYKKKQEGEQWERMRGKALWLCEKKGGKVIFVKRLTPYSENGKFSPNKGILKPKSERKRRTDTKPRPKPDKPVKANRGGKAIKIKAEPLPIKIKDTSNYRMVKIDSRTYKLMPVL